MTFCSLVRIFCYFLLSSRRQNIDTEPLSEGCMQIPPRNFWRGGSYTPAYFRKVSASVHSPCVSFRTTGGLCPAFPRASPRFQPAQASNNNKQEEQRTTRTTNKNKSLAPVRHWMQGKKKTGATGHQRPAVPASFVLFFCLWFYIFQG